MFIATDKCRIPEVAKLIAKANEAFREEAGVSVHAWRRERHTNVSVAFVFFWASRGDRTLANTKACCYN